jgi:hypothetical protein
MSSSSIPYEREREREREIRKEYYGLGEYIRYVSSSPN